MRLTLIPTVLCSPLLIGVALLLGGVAVAPTLEAAELTGAAIMAKVKARDEGEFVTRRLLMRLTDRRGRSRTETAA